MNYESILREAIHNVICIYGNQLNRKEINRLTKREFRKISDEYPMRYVQQDALTAFSCELKGKPWVDYKNRQKMDSGWLKWSREHYPVDNKLEYDLVQYIRNTQPVRG